MHPQWRSDAPSTARQRELDNVRQAAVEAVQPGGGLMAQDSVCPETQQPGHLPTADGRWSTANGVYPWGLGRQQSVRHRGAELTSGQ